MANRPRIHKVKAPPLSRVERHRALKRGEAVQECLHKTQGSLHMVLRARFSSHASLRIIMFACSSTHPSLRRRQKGSK